MGKLIDKTEFFKMRKLEADIDRANDANFHEEFAQMLAEDKGLSKVDRNLIGLVLLSQMPNIILP